MSKYVKYKNLEIAQIMKTEKAFSHLWGRNKSEMCRKILISNTIQAILKNQHKERHALTCGEQQIPNVQKEIEFT